MIDSLPIKLISLPTPFPVGNINSYLFTADPVTIIDPGLCYRPSEEALDQALAESGLQRSDIRRVVITHGHPDHYGLAGKIQRESGAEVLVRDEEVNKIRPDQDYLRQMTRSMETTGLTEEVLSLNYNVVFGEHVPYTHPVESIVPFSGEQTLDFSGFGLRMMHMPGHSGGHTCLYWEEEKVFLSGDLLLGHITAVPAMEYDPGEKNLRRRSLSEMMESMERVRKINPRLCLPGHGGPITEPGDLAGSRIDFHRGRLEEICSLVPRGRENAVTPFQLSRTYYPDVQGFDVFLAVIEVVSHLDCLADQGRIDEAIDERGVSHFYRPE